MAFCGIGIESLHGIAIDVLARAQSAAIAVDKVFIVWGKNLPFEEGELLKGRPEDSSGSSQRRHTTPSGGLYSEVIVWVANYYGNWSAKFQKPVSTRTTDARDGRNR
jgi:hypothetical protein